ncbi:MAG: hypothetical protein ACI4R8_02770 [Candidatus Caccovivens sp.]
MFLGDNGKPNKFPSVRYNYDIIIDDEKFTLQKLSRNLGFYTILFEEKIKDVETVYDTERYLLTGAGLLIRKKNTPTGSYFSLVRISGINNSENREKKSFLGECEPQDQPSDFPVQIADAINKVFNNLFTINVVDIVKHCTPYIRTEITGNRYKIVSGTGYEVEMTFENLKVRDMRSGRKAKVRNFSIEMELNPEYEKERTRILEVIDRWCKELVPQNRNRFEISQVAVRPPVQNNANAEVKVDKKDKKGKKNKKEGNQEE